MNDASASPPSSLVRCVGITHFFGGVRALSGVTLDLHAGSVVGLVGENGAGKTTLLKVLSGVIRPDLGEIWFGDARVTSLTPRAARALGVETVPQNLLLCDNLPAAANVMLGQEPHRFKLGPIRILDRQRAEEETVRRLADLGAVVPDMTTTVRRLSGGQRQAVAIARATVRGHRLIMFDEPTAALGLRQKRATLDLVRRVADQGVAVVLISHNLDEVLAVADRVVALRLGEVSLDARRSEVTRETVEAHMSGFEQLRATS